MSKLGNLAPLLILLFLALVIAGVGYVCYTVAHDVKHHTRQKMEKRNVSFSREGMKVGVKHVDNEHYADKTQGVLVNIWNAASWPAYKSRLGWGQYTASQQSTPSGTPAGTPGVGTEKRKPFSRNSSSQQSVRRA